MRISGTVRSLPGGSGIGSVGVTVRRHSDDAVIGSTTTDSEGRWSLQVNGNPGPYYWTATDTGPDPDVIRKGSSKSAGSGGPYALWDLPLALRARRNGVVEGYANQLDVTLGSGLNLQVNTGAVLALGIPAVWHTATTFPVTATRDPTHPRSCYLVVQVHGLNDPEEGKAFLTTVCGTPAAAPTPPALTQLDPIYQVPLANFTLPNSAGSALSGLVDARRLLGAPIPTVSSIVRRPDPTVPVGGITDTSPTGVDVIGLTTSLTLQSGVTYDLSGRSWLINNTDSPTHYLETAIYLNTVANLGPWLGVGGVLVGTANAHTKDGVVGTGAAVPCGLRVRMTGGSGGYGVGYLQVTARPRR